MKNILAVEKEAEILLNAIDHYVLKVSGFSRDQLLPIAATEFDKDLFVL